VRDLELEQRFAFVGNHEVWRLPDGRMICRWPGGPVELWPDLPTLQALMDSVKRQVEAIRSKQGSVSRKPEDAFDGDLERFVNEETERLAAIKELIEKLDAGPMEASRTNAEIGRVSSAIRRLWKDYIFEDEDMVQIYIYAGEVVRERTGGEWLVATDHHFGQADWSYPIVKGKDNRVYDIYVRIRDEFDAGYTPNLKEGIKLLLQR
jgi:hypothetical protein